MKNTKNVVIVFVVGLGLVLGCTPPKDSNVGEKQDAPAKSTTADDAQKTQSKDESSSSDGGVTMANFQKLKTGMKYEEVVKILGSEGEVLSENEMAGTKTVMYKWDGKEGWGANMNAMFQNGKMVSKSQFGLK